MYNRVHDMFSIFIATDSRVNDYAVGVGHIWAGYADKSARTISGANNPNVLSDTYFKGKARGSDQTVLFNPLSGILNQRTLRFILITIELQLVYDVVGLIVFKTLSCS